MPISRVCNLRSPEPSQGSLSRLRSCHQPWQLNFGLAVFTANNGATGIELCQSDGTEAGMVQIMDIAAGAASSNPTSFTTDNVAFLYMSANDVVRGRELWGMFIAPRVVYLPIVLR